MNLLSIAQSYLSDEPTDIAGIFIHRQFQALKSKGWDIRVINPQHLLHRELKGMGRFYPGMSLRDGIPIWRPRFLWFPRLVENAGFVLERSYASAVDQVIPRVSADWQPDLIVGDWLVPGGFASMKLAQRFRVPLVLRSRGRDVPIVVGASLSSSAYKAYYGQILNSAEKVICQGRGLIQLLLESGLVNGNKLLALTNGIDTRFFHPANGDERTVAREGLRLPQRAQVWLFLGTWEIRKGSQELAQVMPRILERYTDLHMLIVGPIKDTKSQRELELSSSRVKFYGSVNPSETLKFLHASDVFVLPSRWEGLPNALLEAMACGLITIATPIAGIPFLIKHGINGILINGPGVEALEESLINCMENLSTYRALGKVARQTIFKDCYDLDSVADLVHQLFRSLIQPHDKV